MISIKTKEEIQIMREGGRLLAKIMKQLGEEIKPGITTNYLNKVAEDLVLKSGAKPSFKNYQGFPAVLCVSLNEEIVHGIPSERKIKEGDIVSLDLGVFYKGFHTDMAQTFPVGEIALETQRLIKVTKKSLKRGIKKIRPGNTLGDIGNTIQRYIEGQGFNVVRELCGHGIGKNIHEQPDIPNYGKRRTGSELKEGMVLALEPMATIGDWHIKRAKDGYGFETKDGSLSSHFEDTVVVTKTGCAILTSEV